MEKNRQWRACFMLLPTPLRPPLDSGVQSPQQLFGGHLSEAQPCISKPSAFMCPARKLPRFHDHTPQPPSQRVFWVISHSVLKGIKMKALLLELSSVNSVCSCQGTAASNQTPPHSPASLHHPVPWPRREAGGEVILDSAIHIDGVW